MENKNLGIILALIVVIILIGGAYLYGAGPERNLFGNGEPLVNLDNSANQTTNVSAPDSGDHVRGSLAAPVKIVEYSDLECPFCKQFHQTMEQAFDEYGESGKIAWVFRHFPLDSLHSKARHEAEASECAAELGGNDGFWSYIDKIFSVTPSNDGLDPSLLPVLAAEVGLDRNAFETCLQNNTYATKIQANEDEATANGGQGTPFPIIIGPDGSQMALPGAVPLSELKRLIDDQLEKVK